MTADALLVVDVQVGLVSGPDAVPTAERLLEAVADLRRRALEHGALIVCGVMSEMCVSATARTALRLGFGVVLPHDAHATYDIPAVDGIGDAVPAAHVSRVAEWALGDQVEVVPRAAAVTFRAARG